MNKEEIIKLIDVINEQIELLKTCPLVETNKFHFEKNDLITVATNLNKALDLISEIVMLDMKGLLELKVFKNDNKEVIILCRKR